MKILIAFYQERILDGGIFEMTKHHYSGEMKFQINFNLFSTTRLHDSAVYRCCAQFIRLNFNQIRSFSSLEIILGFANAYN